MIHPIGRPRCFVFDKKLRVCEVLTRQNQSVQLRLLCICLPAFRPPGAFDRLQTANLSFSFEKQIIIYHFLMQLKDTQEAACKNSPRAQVIKFFYFLPSHLSQWYKPDSYCEGSGGVSSFMHDSRDILPLSH